MSQFQNSYLSNLQHLQQSLNQSHISSLSDSSTSLPYVSTSSTYQTTTSNLEETYSRKLSNKVLTELESRTKEKLIILGQQQRQKDKENKGLDSNGQSIFTRHLPSIDQHYAASRPNTSSSTNNPYQSVINSQIGANMNSDNEEDSDIANHDISMADSDQSLQIIYEKNLQPDPDPQSHVGMTSTNDQDLKRRRTSQVPSNMGQISASSSRPSSSMSQSSLSQSSLHRALSQRKALSRSRRNSSRRASTLHELIVPLTIRSPGSSPLAGSKIIDHNSTTSDGFTVPTIPTSTMGHTHHHKYQSIRTSPLATTFNFARPTFSAMSKAHGSCVETLQPMLRKPSSRNNLNQVYNEQSSNIGTRPAPAPTAISTKPIPTKATTSQQRTLLGNGGTLPKSKSTRSINVTHSSASSTIPNSSSTCSISSTLSNLTKPTLASLSKSKSFKNSLSTVTNTNSLPITSGELKFTNGMRKSKSLKVGLDSYHSSSSSTSNSGLKKSQTMRFGSEDHRDLKNGMTRSRTVSGNLNTGNGTTMPINNRPAWR